MTMSTTQGLSGKAVRFTRGSRGIGAEIAQRFAADGTALALTCLDQTKTFKGKHYYVTEALRQNRISYGR